MSDHKAWRLLHQLRETRLQGHIWWLRRWIYFPEEEEKEEGKIMNPLFPIFYSYNSPSIHIIALINWWLFQVIASDSESENEEHRKKKVCLLTHPTKKIFFSAIWYHQCVWNKKIKSLVIIKVSLCLLNVLIKKMKNQYPSICSLFLLQKRKLKMGDVTMEKKRKLLNGEAEKSFKKPKMPTDKDKQLQKKLGSSFVHFTVYGLQNTTEKP